MPRQDWAAILDAIYEGEIMLTNPIWDYSENESAFEEIKEKTSLNKSSITSSIKYMSAVGLLEKVSEDREVIGLSKKGFQVAHEREIAERQHQQVQKQGRQQIKSNYAVAFFTFGLLAIAAAEALIQAAIGAEISSFAIITIGLGPTIMFVFLAHKMQELELMSETDIQKYN